MPYAHFLRGEPPSPLLTGPILSQQWQRSVNLIKNASPSADAMLLNGRAPLPGEIMVRPKAASVYKMG